MKPTLKATDLHDLIARSFERQSLMGLIGAELLSVMKGEVCIALPCRADLFQQAGYIHAAVITGIMDTACGYAAKTVMPPQADVLTVEYKVNFLRPARGERFEARGRVLKPGKTLTICTGEVFSVNGEQSELIAIMQATMIAISN